MTDKKVHEAASCNGFFLSIAALSAQPLLVFVVLSAMVFGIYSYFTLPAREDPGILIREAIIQTANPGLGAKEIEQLVTKPLEEALLSIAELDEITSESRNGISVIHTIVADQYTNLDIIFEEVAETVTETLPALPSGTLTPRVIDDFGDVSVITLAVQGTDYSPSELTEMAEHIRTQLIDVPGTKKIDLLGVRERRIFIEFQDGVLSRLGLPMEVVISAIQRENGVLKGGTADLGETGVMVFPVKANGGAKGISDTLLSLPDGQVVRVGDIATVADAYEDPPGRKAYYQGEEAIVLAIAMLSEESVINFSRRMNERIDQVISTLPTGIDVSRITVQSEQVQNAVYGVSVNILQTLIIVLAVVIIFLGLRSGLIIGAIIPAVILATLAIMGVLGMQLERMSLATLVIAVGILVDNGIVIAEDFKHRLQETGDRDLALRITSRELAFPLFTASLTTMLVFLPLLIMNTASSEYTRSISYVIIISLSVSWFFAMTVTTTLCHRFLKVDTEEASQTKGSFIQKAFQKLTNGYESILRRILRFRWLYLGAMIGLFMLAGYMMGLVPQKFFPNSDRAQILVYADLPIGVTSRSTDQAVKQMSQIINDTNAFPEFRDHAAYVGFGGPRFVLSLSPVDPAENSAFIVINTASREAAREAVPRLRNAFLTALPSVNARVSVMFLGPADPNVLQVELKGPDADYLFEKARELEFLLLAVDDTIDVWHDWHGVVERLEVTMLPNEAALAGISAMDVSETIRRQLSGQPIGSIQDGNDLVSIILRGFESERSNIEQLEALSIFNPQTGEDVPLGQVATTARVPDVGAIARKNLVRTVTVESRNLSLTPQDMKPLLEKDLQVFSDSLKPGHSANFSGILEDTQESNVALASTVPIVLFFTVFLLILQFKDFKRPLIILLSLPFVIFGAALGLVLMRASFGFMVILGIYALIGLIINNAIVLIDRIDIERIELAKSGQKMTGTDAIVNACSRRFQPIMMTTITTIIGFLPLIIGQDVLFFGMASAMAFGLGVSTVIVVLGLIPVIYALFFGIANRNEKPRTPRPPEQESVPMARPNQ